MTIKYANAVKVARLDATASLIDAAEGNASLQIYSGAAPAGVGDVTYQVLLATFALTRPGATVANGVLTANLSGRATVVADGRIGWARLIDGNGLALADYEVGLIGSGADLTMATLDVNKDSALEASSAVLES